MKEFTTGKYKYYTVTTFQIIWFHTKNFTPKDEEQITSELTEKFY